MSRLPYLSAVSDEIHTTVTCMKHASLALETLEAATMSSPDTTPDAILHLATLHLLSKAGFASTSQAASLTLSSVVAQYFKTVSRACIDRANLAGRNKPGAYDVVESLKELGYGFGLEELYEYGLDSRGGDVFHGEALEKLSGRSSSLAVDNW